MAEWDVVDETPADSGDQWAPTGEQAATGWEVADEQPEDPSMGGVAARGLARGAGPALTGLGVGLRAGAMAAPLGPLPAIGIGLGAGALAGGLASFGQNELLKKMGWREGGGFWSEEQEAADEAAHPWVKTAAEMAPAAAMLRPGGTMAERAIGGAIGGLGSAGMEYLQTGEVEPRNVLAGAAMGAALPNVNKFGARVAGPGIHGVPETKSARPNPENTPIEPTQETTPHSVETGQPEFQEVVDPADLTVANDITTTAKGVAAENPPVPQNAATTGNQVGAPMMERQGARPNEPERDYRKDKPPAADQGSTQPTTTISDAPIHEDVAAALVAEQPPPTAPVETGLTPEQQTQQVQPTARTMSRMDPMEASQIAREGQQRAIEAARARNQEQQRGEAFQGPEPAPQSSMDATIEAAAQYGMRRKIVETPMPSGANSSKDPRGPVYVDPTVPEHLRRFVAVHETVEGSLMAQGMPYAQAHAEGTKAERAAVERAGINWDHYSRQWDGVLAKIEKERPVSLPGDLHVDPMEALGHHQKGQAVEAPPPKAPVETGLTAAVTRGEQKVIDTVREKLKGHKALAEFEALPPKEQARRGAQGLAAERSVTGKARGTEGEALVPRKERKLSNGMGYRDEADRVRKQGALDAVSGAMKDLGEAKFTLDPSLENRAAIEKHAKETYERATALNDGTDPIKAYRMQTKEPAYNIVKAARALTMKPTWKATQEYVEALALKGEIGQNIEGELAKKQRPAVEDVEGKIERPTAQRPEHDLFTNEKRVESPRFTIEHNQLTNWLNGLSEKTHARLMDAYPDLELDVRKTQDPAALMQEYLNKLTETPQPRVLEDLSARPYEPEPEPPAEKKAPIPRTTESDRFKPTKEGGKAGEARVLDKNSPEFKRIAEQALGKKAVDRTGQLEHEETAAGVKPEPAAKGTWKEAGDHFKSMMSDESGNAKLDQAFDWMKDKARDYFAAKPPDAIKEYGDQLGGDFTRLANRLTEFKGYLRANALTSPLLQNAEKSQIYRAMEKGEMGLLPAKLKDYYTSYVKPLEAKYGPMYDVFRLNALANKLAKPEDLPERKNNGNGFMSWVARIQKGKHAWDAADDVDPAAAQSGQSLNMSADTLKARDWFTLQNTQGDRLTYIPGDNQMTVMRNGAPTKIPFTSTSFDPRDIGSTIKLKVKGNQDTWTVDHATIDEITSAGGKTNGVPNIQFHDDPVVTMTNALYGLNSAYERQQMYLKLVESQMFKDNTTRSYADAKEKGWVSIDLPQFAGLYAPKPIAWAINDFVKRGFSLKDTSAEREKGFIDRASQNFAKLFYFFGPAVHALNEADKWAIGRGFNWVTPQGMRSLVVNGMKAVKSVNTQDAIQHEMIEAGANPMLMHTLTRDLMPKVARATGMDIVKNTSKWDPVARAFGVSTKEMAKRAYDASSAGMWWVSDVLATQRYLEEKELRNLPLSSHFSLRQTPNPSQISNEAAVKSMHDFIDSYQMPTTVAGSRFVQQGLSDPSASLFGPYHYGVFHTASNMLKNLVGKDASLADRARAAGQTAVLMAMIYAVYPALTAGYRAVTGDKTPEVEPRGLSRLINTGKEVGEGNKGAEALLRNVWTPAIGLDTLWKQIANKDYRGQPIIEQGASARQKAAQEAEFVAGQLVSPYKTISSAAEKPEATPGNVARKFGEGMVGIHTPSEAEAKYKETVERHNNTSMKRRLKRPVGVIEHLFGGE